MKIVNVDAQRLLMGLRSIDSDESTNLDAEIRMKIAININRLMPNVQAFERIASQIQARMSGNGHEGSNGSAVLNTGLAVMQELQRLSEGSEDYNLKKLTVAELKLKDNPKIKSDIIARLAPIIKDFDDGESDE